MIGYKQISRLEFYARGGLENPKLIRKQHKNGWTYWKEQS